MHRYLWLGLFLFTVSISSPVMAVDEALPSDQADQADQAEPAAEHMTQTIVQIGGRFCEYHRKDVEQALHRYEAVRSIEFLNDHGTVLVRYEAGGVPPDQLAETAAQAAFGTGCRATNTSTNGR